jgi:hypothetical protein
MKWQLAVGVAVLAMSAQSVWADAEFLWGLTGGGLGTSGILYQVNPANGAVLGVIGNTGLTGMGGLAIQPGSRALFAAQGNVSPKGLYRLDRNTAAATLVGSTGRAISGIVFRASGVLYGWSQLPAKELVTINTSTGVVTAIGTNINTATNAAIAFTPNGNLYLVRGGNAIYQIDPATGNAIGTLKQIVGATMSIDNLLASNSAGTLYTGDRAGGGTQLYTVNPATGVTTSVGTVSGACFSAIAFDTAPSPTLTVTGKKKITSKRTSILLKGTATSMLPLTVSIKGKTTVVANGAWSLKLKLKRGKNIFVIGGSDALGQSAAGGRVTVIRK